MKLSLNEVLTARSDKCFFCGKDYILMSGICLPCREEILCEPIPEGDNLEEGGANNEG